MRCQQARCTCSSTEDSTAAPQCLHLLAQVVPQDSTRAWRAVVVMHTLRIMCGVCMCRLAAELDTWSRRMEVAGQEVTHVLELVNSKTGAVESR